MGTSSYGAQINEVASYLYTYDKQLRERLQVEGDAQKKLLELGIELGEPESAAIDKELLSAKCRIVGLALESARAKSKKRCYELQERVQTLRKLRFCTALGSAITAGITSIAAIMEESTATIVSSVATFAGAAANAAATSIVLGQNGTEAEVLEIIQDLYETEAFSDLTLKYLKAVADGDYPVEEASVLIAEANLYFSRIIDSLKRSTKYLASVDE